MASPLSALSIGHRRVGLIDVLRAYGFPDEMYLRLLGGLADSGIYDEMMTRIKADISDDATRAEMQLLTEDLEARFSDWIRENAPEFSQTPDGYGTVARALVLDAAERMRDVIEDEKTAVLSYTRDGAYQDVCWSRSRVLGDVDDEMLRLARAVAEMGR